MNKDLILNTNKSDLPFIYHLFDEAMVYQEKNNYPVWNGYDKAVLVNDIDHQLQYKLLKAEEIAYVFSICYTDKIIWRERDIGDSIYLHRMVVNRKFKGQKIFLKVLNWMKEYCKDKDLRFLRMDTWADNPKIIDYSLSCGFYTVGYFKTPDTEELPVQQRNNNIVLLEMEI